MSEEAIYVVAVSVSRAEPGKTIYSMTQCMRVARSEGDAIAEALAATQKLKPGFAIEDWLVTKVTAKDPS